MTFHLMRHFELLCAIGIFNSPPENNNWSLERQQGSSCMFAHAREELRPAPVGILNTASRESFVDRFLQLCFLVILCPSP